jgi:hypothetical protein
VPEGDVLNPKSLARIDQCVIGVPALSKYFGDAFLFQTLGHEHCAGHLKSPSSPAEQS